MISIIGQGAFPFHSLPPESTSRGSSCVVRGRNRDRFFAVRRYRDPLVRTAGGTDQADFVAGRKFLDDVQPFFERDLGKAFLNVIDRNGFLCLEAAEGKQEGKKNKGAGLEKRRHFHVQSLFNGERSDI